MTANSLSRPVHLTKLPSGGIAISVDMECGRVPILAFPNWENFAEFAAAIQDFYSEMKPDVPNVYKQAFHNYKSL